MTFLGLFLDIDGTLVSFRTHRVPASAVEALRLARKRGVRVFICTGRPLQFINNIGEVEHDGLICATGALCLDAEGRTLHSQAIDKGDIGRLLQHLDAARGETMPVLAVGRERIYGAGRDSAQVAQVMQYLNVSLPPIHPISEAVGDDILQLIAFYGAEQDEVILGQVLTHCIAQRWHPAFADLVDRRTSKATGIDRICESLGIPLSRTLSVGDGGNDILMLRHTAVGVAMGGASEAVKAAADYVTGDVDEDGLANALRHFGVI